MIVELGHFATIIALLLTALLAVFGLYGAQTNNLRLQNAVGSLVAGKLVFLALAFGALIYAFQTDNFSVEYVAANSNTLLPWYYKVSAVWGAHEGSFLLWCLVMAMWTFAVAMTGQQLELKFRAQVLGVMGLLNLGFLSFLVFTSNPFDRLLPLSPEQGSDLNPVLQDFGLIVHPPMLYVGYVGFSVAFSFAVAALLNGRLDTAWARWSRPWTNVAWAFLTMGIGLGSWWAYYELGWGGWWAWDPVENASFMPWLVGTALVHSLAVSEKRGTFKGWTVLLALGAFTMSLIGAFLVRSGVLTSVHSFASDPTRGTFILVFLLLVVGGALTLYATRASVIRSTARYSWLSRESFLLLNNLLFVGSLGLVFLGTLYPLAYEAVTGGDKISVGIPYFNFGFVPMMILVAISLGLVPVLRWKRTDVSLLWQRLGWVALASLVLGVGLPLLVTGTISFAVVLTVMLGLWITGSHVADWIRRARNSQSTSPPAYKGMQLAHIGFAVTLIGAGLTSALGLEREVALAAGEKTTLGAYEFEFVGVAQEPGPNYMAQRGTLIVRSGDSAVTLFPEERRYLSGGEPLSEVAIDANLFRDLYISLGSQLPSGAWSMRLQVKPFVRWIWLGIIFMSLGAVWAVLDPRYRRKRVLAAAPASGAAAPASGAAAPASGEAAPASNEAAPGVTGSSA